MSIAGLVGKAQTVVGAIDPTNLGITLPHEHLVFDGKTLVTEPDGASDRGLAYKPVSLKTLSWLRYHPYESVDNMQLLDEQEAIAEVLLYKQAGGSTVVELSTRGLGRDPRALARIAQATGLNIIMGSGYHAAPTQPTDIAFRSEEEITEEIVRDITVGVGDTGIRAGIIGEIGGSWPLLDVERKVMRASARAQQITGAPLNIHPGRKEECLFEIVKVLDSAGADLSRVIMSHVDARLGSHNERCQLAKTGCVIEYDLWGWEGHFPLYFTADLLNLPNDTQRVYDILQLINDGYLNQILISHDICTKSRCVCYGGWGYAHISNYVVPMMLKRDMTSEQINTIMVENPKRLLQFV